MFQKMACFAVILVVILGYHDMGTAMGLKDNDEYGLKHRVLLLYSEAHKDKVTRVFSVTGKSNQLSESREKEYEELKEELEEFFEEMKRLENEAREKVLKEILPQIEREIEKLRERLRQWRREDDEPEPAKVETTSKAPLIITLP